MFQKFGFYGWHLETFPWAWRAGVLNLLALLQCHTKWDPQWKVFAILEDLCPAAQNLIIAKYGRNELPLTLKISSKSIHNILSYPVHKQRINKATNKTIASFYDFVGYN